MAIEIKAVSGFRKYPKITSPISLCTQLEVDISLQIILMDSLLADLNAAMEASLTPRDLHNVHILEYFSNICVLDRPCFILASLTGRNQISFLPYGVLRISGISGMIRCDCMSVFFVKTEDSTDTVEPQRLTESNIRVNAEVDFPVSQDLQVQAGATAGSTVQMGLLDLTHRPE